MTECLIEAVRDWSGRGGEEPQTWAFVNELQVGPDGDGSDSFGDVVQRLGQIEADWPEDVKELLSWLRDQKEAAQWVPPQMEEAIKLDTTVDNPVPHVHVWENEKCSVCGLPWEEVLEGAEEAVHEETVHYEMDDESPAEPEEDESAYAKAMNDQMAVDAAKVVEDVAKAHGIHTTVGEIEVDPDAPDMVEGPRTTTSHDPDDEGPEL